MYLEYKRQRGKPRKGKVRAMHRAHSHQSQIPTPYSVRLVTTLVLEPLLHNQVEGKREEARA